MAERMLRGKAPLTMWRGAGGPGGLLYRGGVLDPLRVDEVDRARLVSEGFLEWVVPNEENWKLAEDTATGKAGDPVTVGDVSTTDPSEVDPGTVNSEAATVPVPDPDETRRAEARAKLAELGGAPDGRSSEAVWVEYAVSQGLDRGEAEKAGKDELRKALGKG